MAAFPTGIILDVGRAAGRHPVTAGPGGEYLTECPWREQHNHGDRKPSCRLNPAGNVFYCDPCGQGGGVREFAEALGVDLAPLLRTAPTALGGPPRQKRPLVFKPQGPISEKLQRHFATHLAKDYTPETWAAFAVVQGSVHPDGLPDKSEEAIVFPLPSGGLHVYRYRRTDKRKRWAFANGGKPCLITAGLDRPDPVILAEGEWDAMRAYELGYAVATATGAGVFQPEWAQAFVDRRTAVVYDVDPAGRRGAQRLFPYLQGHASLAWIVDLPLSGNPDTDGKDLSDFVAVQGEGAFRQLIHVSEPSAPAPETQAATVSGAGLAGSILDKLSVARAIDILLGGEGPVRIKRREASKLVIGDLRRRGDLIRATGGRQFWFDAGTRRLLDLDGFEFRARMIEGYQVNPAEREFAHIIEAVKAETRARGKRVTICRFAFYSHERGCLYVYAGQARVLRLDGATATWVDNGTDELLFEDDLDLPVIPTEAPSHLFQGDPLRELLLDRVNFIRGTGVILSHEQQCLMLRVWILSVFFPELLPAKCLLLIYGEKGSGKTTALRVILKLLLGPQANVTPLVNKEDGFNASVSQEYLLVLDNVDSYCRWIEDRLATVATGQTIRLRKLYTTNEMVSFPTRCCIALTARTPRFRRDDVVDRLQILRVARLEKFSREAKWYAELEERRLDLWAQLICHLNSIVACLRRVTDDASDTIRMADWGFVATTIGQALGQREAVRSALEASELDKAHFLLEADELYDLLHAVGNDDPGREWKAGELFAELKRRAEEADLEFRIKSPRSLGRILHRLEPALKRMIRFEIRTLQHDGQAAYVLGPLSPGSDTDET